MSSNAKEKDVKGFLVSKTNPLGKITYCNASFIVLPYI